MTVNHRRKKLIKNACPNHTYRSRTIRDGKLEKFCALCINQAAMRERWKNIRKAFATIRCFTPKSPAAAKPVSVFAARNQWEVSIVRAASSTPVTEGTRVFVVIDCGQGRLTVLESAA
jgi:hypothetical protein